MKFTKQKDFSIPHISEHRKLKNSIRTLKYSTYFVISVVALYGAVQFYNTHDFRTPVIFQNPIPIKQTKIISPVGKKKVSIIPQAYASTLETHPSVKFYPYQDQISKMDTEQKEVMKQVENKLGYAYAELVFRESGFHPLSVNSIGACGLGQANPCSKLPCELTNVDCQLNWVKSYVENRYTTIDNALTFHNEKGWY